MAGFTSSTTTGQELRFPYDPMVSVAAPWPNKMTTSPVSSDKKTAYHTIQKKGGKKRKRKEKGKGKGNKHSVASLWMVCIWFV